MNKKKVLIVAVCVIAVILVLSVVFIAINKHSKDEGSNDSTSVQGESNAKLAEIQSRIDAQQKIIDQKNDEMTPLIEERTKLEEQLMAITSSESSDAAEEVIPEETPEEEAPAEETPAEETPAE